MEMIFGARNCLMWTNRDPVHWFTVGHAYAVVESGRFIASSARMHGVPELATCKILGRHDCRWIIRSSGSSPGLYKNLLVLVRGRSRCQYVTALDKKTGNPFGRRIVRRSMSPA